MTDECEIRNGWRHRTDENEGYEFLEQSGASLDLIEKVLTKGELTDYCDWLYCNIE
jgi:hypothetical protein